MKIYVVFGEESDRFGIDRCVGVYSIIEKAKQAEDSMRYRRSFTKEFELDAEVDASERYKIR